MTNKYDLEDRTARFAESIIDLCKKWPKNAITLPLIDQLIRAGTSIGANYCEANGASSKKDFKNKIFICKKESKESQYWLRLLAKTTDDESLKKNCRVNWQEAKEFSMIFASIANKTT
nr:MAG: four helix bundle protein [Candidatus Amesbacteria bacterium RBG_19FT_COMBO_48_16]